MDHLVHGTDCFEKMVITPSFTMLEINTSYPYIKYIIIILYLNVRTFKALRKLFHPDKNSSLNTTELFQTLYKIKV